MPPDEEFVLKTGMEIINRNNNGSTITADRRFREAFGCAVAVVVELWQKLEPYITVNKSAQVSHMFWALMFLKTYSKETVLSGMAGGVDEKTFRKWIWLFVCAIASLESDVVSAVASRTQTAAYFIHFY